MPPDGLHDPRREKRFKTCTVHVEVFVGYRQTCVVCGQRFNSEKPATTHNNACKQRLKRRRQEGKV